MKELIMQEVGLVNGAVIQSNVIATNLTIIAIGAGAVFAGMTAPAWGPIALIGLSFAVTGTYIYEQL
ncbi:MAG: hypothetical protein WKF61_01910 [Luteimonas sp.]